MAAVFISQADHHTNGFGRVLRSSGIFYYVRDAHVRTTITFMNYWALKRGIEVAAVASLRDMKGRLLRRDSLDFSRGTVVEYAPETPTLPFEGSVEIEVFAARDLVIPFAALIAVYETASSISMVHSYGRTYSAHEIEEGRTIAVGEESCWTLRDGGGVRSFAVFHNGNAPQPSQTGRLTVRRDDGTTRSAAVTLPALAPYGSYRLVPADHMAGLDGFLDGRPGNAAFSYRLANAFTRMLVGNRRDDDLQVTHSNFDYTRHRTDCVEGEDAEAQMQVPDGAIHGRRVRVYPDADPGHYTMQRSGETCAFASGQTLDFSAQPGLLRFRKTDGRMPTRLVTALVGENGGDRLPFELSLGVLHHDRPAKRLWWAPTACDSGRFGAVVATAYPEIYGPPGDAPIVLRLHATRNQETLEAILHPNDLPAIGRGVRIDDVFPRAIRHLAGACGWFTWYSEYGGYQVFSRIDRRDGGMTFEHGF